MMPEIAKAIGTNAGAVSVEKSSLRKKGLLYKERVG